MPIIHLWGPYRGDPSLGARHGARAPPGVATRHAARLMVHPAPRALPFNRTLHREGSYATRNPPEGPPLDDRLSIPVQAAVFPLGVPARVTSARARLLHDFLPATHHPP